MKKIQTSVNESGTFGRRVNIMVSYYLNYCAYLTCLLFIIIGTKNRYYERIE